VLRARYVGNNFQKRTIRVLQGNWTATPFSTILDPSLLGSGSNDPDLYTDLYNIPANVYTLQGSILPGTVMARGANGNGSVVVASGVGGGQPAAYQAFGLLNNFVGGTFDELWGDPFVSVWQGPDSVYQILYPAFNSTGLSAAFTAAPIGQPVPLYAGPDGRLACSTAFAGGVGSQQVVAYLLDYPSNGYISVQLKV
jgi:hypothetical protein